MIVQAVARRRLTVILITNKFRKRWSIRGAAPLLFGSADALDTSVGAGLAGSVETLESAVFKRLLLTVDALSVILFTSKDVACTLVVDPLFIRIADCKSVICSEVMLRGQ